MLATRRTLLITLAALALAACGGGETEVTGGTTGDDTGATGPTATGASGATATGATGTATGSTGAAYSLALEGYPAEVTDVAFYTCDGLEGTWRYVFQAEFAPGIAFDIDEEVSMAGGEGRLRFSGELEIAGAGTVSFTDTIDLRLNGSRSIEATSIRVDVDAGIPGFSVDLFDGLFPEGRPIPIVEGSDRC